MFLRVCDRQYLSEISFDSCKKPLSAGHHNMQNFQRVFGTKQCSIIGMIHVKALPGTPKYDGDFNATIEHAKREAMIYRKHQIVRIHNTRISSTFNTETERPFPHFCRMPFSLRICTTCLTCRTRKSVGK